MTRSTEATQLNATLDQLVEDVSAYLAAGCGDHHEARSVLWNVLRNRLAPVMGPIEGGALSSNDTDAPDSVNADGRYGG